jgi:hypothetical protein
MFLPYGGKVKQVGLRAGLLVCVLPGVLVSQGLAQEATTTGTAPAAARATVPRVAVTIKNTDAGQVRRI